MFIDGKLRVAAVTFGIVFAHGQSAGAASANLEYAGISAIGQTIDITRLPVSTSKGVLYKDVVINLSVDSTGNVTFASKPTVTNSPTLPTSKFVAGRYFANDYNTAYYGTLTSSIDAAGGTVWNLIMDQQSGGNYPQQASWQSNAPSPDVAARITAAKITKNPNYSYGVTPVGGSYTFYSNGLVAAEQVNGNLTLVSYTLGGTDQKLPNGSIILTRCANASCSNAPQSSLAGRH